MATQLSAGRSGRNLRPPRPERGCRLSAPWIFVTSKRAYRVLFRCSCPPNHVCSG